MVLGHLALEFFLVINFQNFPFGGGVWTLTIVSGTEVFLIKKTDSIVVTCLSSTHSAITVHNVCYCLTFDGLKGIGGLIDVE